MGDTLQKIKFLSDQSLKVQCLAVFFYKLNKILAKSIFSNFLSIIEKQLDITSIK